MPGLEREQSLRITDLRALAHELDMQEKQDQREASAGQEMEYVPPPAALYSSKSRGLARENRPRRLNGGGRNRSPVPSAASAHSAISAMTNSTNTGSNHYANYTNHSMDSSAGDHSIGGSSFNDSYGDFHNSASSLQHHNNTMANHNSAGNFAGGGSGIDLGGSTSSGAAMPTLRRAQTTTGAPPSLRRAHTTTGQRRGLAGKRGVRGAAGRDPGFHRTSNDDVSSVRSSGGGGGPGFHRSSTTDSVGTGTGSRRTAGGGGHRPEGARSRSPVPAILISNNITPPRTRDISPTGRVLDGSPTRRATSVSPRREDHRMFHGSGGDSLPGLPQMGAGNNSNNNNVRQKQRRQTDMDAHRKAALLEPTTSQESLGTNYSYGGLNTSEHSVTSASSVPIRSTSRNGNRLDRGTGTIAPSELSRGDSTATSGSRHSRTSRMRNSTNTRGSTGPAPTTLQRGTSNASTGNNSTISSSAIPPPAPLTYRATKGLSGNAAPSQAEVTRLQPANLSASYTSNMNLGASHSSALQASFSRVNASNSVQPGLLDDDASAATAPPQTSLGYRATKGLSAQPSPTDLTRVDPVRNYGIGAGSNHSDRSRSPVPPSSTRGGRQQQPQQDFDLIEDDADENQDTFVQHTQLQMNLIGAVSCNSGDKNGKSLDSSDDPAAPAPGAVSQRPGATAQRGLGGGADRNDVRRAKFGLSEPTDVTLVASVAKGSKRSLTGDVFSSKELNTTEHSSATRNSDTTETQMQVGAYRVNQPRSANQQRPGAPMNAQVSTSASIPPPSMNDVNSAPPDNMMVNIDDGSKKKMKKLSTQAKTAMLGTILVIIVIIIIAAVAAGGGNGEDDSSVSEQGPEEGEDMTDLVLSTRPPDTDMATYLLNLLPEEIAEVVGYSLPGAMLLGNETSVSAEPSASVSAFDWMLEDSTLIKYSDPRLLQRFALASLYFATDGDAWAKGTNWLSFDHHECNWFGRRIECSDAEGGDGNYDAGFITSIKLSRAKLEGTIPEGLSLLTNVEFVDLSENKLKGSIPAAIGAMTSLQRIVLGENEISGHIPSQVGLLTNLIQFSAQENALSGTLAPELGNLGSLAELILSINKISGMLPISIGRLSKLERLYLDENSLVGSIPEELYSLTKLQDLYLNGNRLGSTISSSLGQLNALARLSLHSNALSGTLPTEVGSLSRLVALWLERNSLRGRIPTEISTMSTSLRMIYMFHNSLTGPLPDMSLLSSLSELKLNMNRLTSTIPVTFNPVLRHLALDQNMFSGPLHTEIGLLTNLNELWLFSNRFTGTVPSELGLCTKLDRLLLDQNPVLRGTLPEEINNLNLLKEFNVSLTQISGTFPSRFCEIMFNDFTCSSTMCGCGERCACEVPSN